MGGWGFGACWLSAHAINALLQVAMVAVVAAGWWADFFAMAVIVVLMWAVYNGADGSGKERRCVTGAGRAASLATQPHLLEHAPGTKITHAHRLLPAVFRRADPRSFGHTTHSKWSFFGRLGPLATEGAPADRSSRPQGGG